MVKRYYVPEDFELIEALGFVKGIAWTDKGIALAELVYDYIKGVKDPKPFKYGETVPGIKWVLEKPHKVKESKIKEFLFSCNKAKDFLKLILNLYKNALIIWFKKEEHKININTKVIDFVKEKYKNKQFGVIIENSGLLGYFYKSIIDLKNPERARWYNIDNEKISGKVFNKNGTLNPPYKGKLNLVITIPVKKMRIKLNKEKLETLYLKKIYKTLEELNS
jgi:hypothetical protein